jgi:hypothetical protein
LKFINNKNNINNFNNKKNMDNFKTFYNQKEKDPNDPNEIRKKIDNKLIRIISNDIDTIDKRNSRQIVNKIKIKIKQNKT